MVFEGGLAVKLQDKDLEVGTSAKKKDKTTVLDLLGLLDLLDQL